MRYFLYLLYLYKCLDPGLFMSNLCDLFFILIFVFIMINHIILRIQTSLFFCMFLENVLLISGKECEQFLNSRSSASGSCLTFGIAYKSIAYKKSIYIKRCISGKISAKNSEKIIKLMQIWLSHPNSRSPNIQMDTQNIVNVSLL